MFSFLAARFHDPTDGFTTRRRRRQSQAGFLHVPEYNFRPNCRSLSQYWELHHWLELAQRKRNRKDKIMLFKIKLKYFRKKNCFIFSSNSEVRPTEPIIRLMTIKMSSLVSLIFLSYKLNEECDIGNIIGVIVYWDEAMEISKL